MKNVSIKFGPPATRELLRLLERAQDRAVIVSPWLSPGTARIATRLQHRGTKVTIMTTDHPTPSHRRALRELVVRRERVVRPSHPRLVLAGAATVAAGSVGLLASVLLALPLLAPVTSGAVVLSGLVLWAVGRELRERYWTPTVSRLDVFHAQPLLHAKLYVSDLDLVVGSPNFTVTGLYRSIESLVFVRDTNLITHALHRLSAALARSGLVRLPIHRVARLAWSSTALKTTRQGGENRG